MKKFLILSVINSVLIGAWRPSVKVSEDVRGGDVRIATNPYGIYIVYWTKRELQKCPDVFGRMSLNNGITWEIMNFDWGTPTTDEQPDVTADNQDVYVTWKLWEGHGIAVRNSYDNGINWGEIIKVSGENLLSHSPVIGQSNNILYVFW